METLMNVDWSKLPQPVDDGGARHLVGLRLPSVPLPATDGSQLDLSRLEGRTVVYAYPRTGEPDVAVPEAWDAIPGARGCTPQSCDFRDHAADLRALGAAHLFGLSTQDTAYQREVVERLRLPFPLLSDAGLALANALRLPRFDFEGKPMLQRLTMILRDGTIEHVFYPVFPPDRSATDVLAWLEANPIRS
jgi:peroxiredoxin